MDEKSYQKLLPDDSIYVIVNNTLFYYRMQISAGSGVC